MEKFFMNNMGRLIFAGLLSLVCFAGFKAKVVHATESNPVMAQTDYRRNANYIRVYNEDDVAHEAGDVLIYVLPASATYDGLSVSTTTSASVGRVAGVVPVGETLKASSWGRLQTYGYHPAVTIAVANSEGAELITSSTGEAAGVYSSGAEHGIVFATALEATTSSTTVKALIKAE